MFGFTLPYSRRRALADAREAARMDAKGHERQHALFKRRGHVDPSPLSPHTGTLSLRFA